MSPWDSPQDSKRVQTLRVQTLPFTLQQGQTRLAFSSLGQRRFGFGFPDSSLFILKKSHISQTDPKLTVQSGMTIIKHLIFLALPPKGWDYRCSPPPRLVLQC